MFLLYKSLDKIETNWSDLDETSLFSIQFIYTAF